MYRDDSADVIRPVPQRRIIEKMNDYMSRRDYGGAERHLLYWLDEAKLGRDLRGQLMLQNELIGHYRKTAQRESFMESAGKALELLELLGMEDTISAGTTYVNIATACNAFGEYSRSMEMFRRARAAYEGSSYTEPQLLGGLYNNMALTCAALGERAAERESEGSAPESAGSAGERDMNAQEWYEEALELYEKALHLMAEVPDGELEQAITYLNMANTVEAQLGMEEGESRICGLVERAEELLEKKSDELLGKDDALSALLSGDREALSSLSRETRARLGYFAFVCEKCAPTFSYYGYFLTAEKLAERADRLAGVL